MTYYPNMNLGKRIYDAAIRGEKMVLDTYQWKSLSTYMATVDLGNDPDFIVEGKGQYVCINEAKIVVANAFSLQMLSELQVHDMDIVGLPYAPKDYDHFYSVVGHPDLAAVIGVKANRENYRMDRGDLLFVAQYSGGRLPEGCTQLPEGAKINWWAVQHKLPLDD